jgi:capsule polysaccharide export protein KpsE/RkpR
LQSAKKELDDASQQFSQYASKNTAVDITAQERAMVESAAMLQGQLIAAQSELEGLQQIYTENNIRVKTLRARIGELQRQLAMMGGSEAADSQNSKNEEPLYPSIRKLPLLGVRWADLYRQTKIAETVYDMLRQRYELARIEEAKEVPTVKVLDEPAVPEKKASPHRLIIILICTLITFLGASVWVIGKERWQQVDPQHPRKLLAITAYEHTRSKVESRVRPLYTRFVQRNHRDPNKD